MSSAPPELPADRASSWISPARYVVAWFIPALLSILTKLLTLANGRGFRVVARYLGRVEGLGYPGLNFAERLTFFRSEILWLFLLVPLALLVALRLLTRRWRVIAMAALCAGTSLIIFLQARSLEEVGDFVSFAMIRVALTWGVHDPGANKSYLFTREFYILVGALLMVAAILIWAAREDQSERLAAGIAPIVQRPQNETLLRNIAIAYASGAALAAGVAWLPLLPATPYHENVLAHSIRAFWGSGAVDTREFENLSIDVLSSRYREMVNAPESRPDGFYFGSMRGANLIVFVLETEPERFLKSDDSLEDLPTMHRLASKSIIATQHFTTYPYTNQALFSVFSSSYPPDGTHSFGEEHPDSILPGIATVLGAHGYATTIYFPAPPHGDPDINTFHSFGFQREVWPAAADIRAYWPAGLTPDWKAERVARDLAVLVDGKNDIERWLSSGQSFFATFAFQVGHLPWPDDAPDDGSVNIVTRNRRILEKQDSWFGEIVAMLEKHRQLDNTVIAMFGDHGIRTQHEDPNFVGGTLDDYSFHVPMRIYAPRTVTAPVKIDSLTSHIDIAPTLLDLLGIDRRRELEQGTPMWNPGIADRTTFFLARQTFGTDGFHSGSQFFMWNQLSDTVSASAQPHFEIRDVLPTNSSNVGAVQTKIRRLLSFEQVWLDKISQIR